MPRASMTPHNRPRVVIVGAGFAGLRTAQVLAKTPVEVVLLDRENYHTFLPLLYQVAAAELEPEDIAYPARRILWKLPHVQFALAEVRKVDFGQRLVETAGSPIPYDYLILATGSVSHFFGVPGAAEHAFPLKTVEEGIALRNHLLCCFERAVHEPDPTLRHRLLTFTIVGGGPTGVEFAGALVELIRGPLPRDYAALDFREVRVVLVEAQDGLLSGLPERLRSYALSRLSRMGIEVRLRTHVRRVTPEAAELHDGTALATETVAWTAGVQGDPSARAWSLPVTRTGRVAVLPTLQVPDHPEVYVIGDLASVEEGGHPLPMIAPVAIQQAEHAARNLGRQVAGQDPLPFRFRDPGAMVTLGRNAGVVRLGDRTFTGFVAWVLWLVVHVLKLVGFRNRLFVLINWAWDYLFYERAVRLILPRSVMRVSGPARCVVGQAASQDPER